MPVRSWAQVGHPRGPDSDATDHVFRITAIRGAAGRPVAMSPHWGSEPGRGCVAAYPGRCLAMPRAPAV
jgi:hypothetical protein